MDMGLYKEVTDERIEHEFRRFEEGSERALMEKYRKAVQYEEGLTPLRTQRTLVGLAKWKQFCGKNIDKLDKDDVLRGLANLEHAQRELRSVTTPNGQVQSEKSGGKYSEWSKITYKLTLKKFLRPQSRKGLVCTQKSKSLLRLRYL